MSNYTTEEIKLLRQKICPECNMSLYREKDTWYCQGANGSGTSGCDFWMADDRYKELTK